MSSLIRNVSLRLILVLAGLVALPFAAYADGLQSIADAASQYASSIADQYGEAADPAAAATSVKDGNRSLAAGDADAATTAFEKAIGAGDKSAATWNLLANAQMRRSDYTNAESATYNAYQAATKPAAPSHPGKGK